MALFYLIAQFGGAFAGAFLTFAMTEAGSGLNIRDGSTGGESFVFQACVIETISALIFTVVFFTQTDKNAKFSRNDDLLNSLFTSVALGVCVLLAYPISGGCLNPAVGLGICVINLFDQY
jgi:glycerol uptake facilitator-like aquaporin